MGIKEADKVMIVFGGGEYKGRLWRFVAMMIHFIDLGLFDGDAEHHHTSCCFLHGSVSGALQGSLEYKTRLAVPNPKGFKS